MMSKISTVMVTTMMEKIKRPVRPAKSHNSKSVQATQVRAKQPSSADLHISMLRIVVTSVYPCIGKCTLRL